MGDAYRAPEVFEIGPAREVIAGSVKTAPPPDQIMSSNLSLGGDLDESDED
jgi:hypothetical protein